MDGEYTSLEKYGWKLPSKAMRDNWAKEVYRYLGEQGWTLQDNSMDNLVQILPWFYHNDLLFLKNLPVRMRVLGSICETVVLAEQQLKKEFGGFIPESYQFGMRPLRMLDLNFMNAATTGPAQWKWTDVSKSSINWSSTDTMVNSFNLADTELMLIYGYFNFEAYPNTLEIAIEPGSVKFPIWQMEPMQIKTDPYLIFPESFILETNSQFQVGASTRSGTTAVTERAGFLGYFFAPQSILLKKK